MPKSTKTPGTPKHSRRIIDGNAETTWLERCSDVLARFCTGVPPADLVKGWFTDSDDSRLQDWVNMHLQPSACWAQGIELIDAAGLLADAPAEWHTPFGHMTGYDRGPHHERPEDWARTPSAEPPMRDADAALDGVGHAALAGYGADS